MSVFILHDHKNGHRQGHGHGHGHGSRNRHRHSRILMWCTGYRIPPYIEGSNIRLSSISFVADNGMSAPFATPLIKSQDNFFFSFTILISAAGKKSLIYFEIVFRQEEKKWKLAAKPSRQLGKCNFLRMALKNVHSFNMLFYILLRQSS